MKTQNEVESARHMGQSKIGRLRVQGIDYPQLRLPKQYHDVVGDLADIFEVEHDSKRAFLIVAQGKVSESKAVLKPRLQVLKL